MFQFGNSRSDTNNAPEGSALPNFYGKIRTLKEDYENFKKGVTSSEEDQPDSSAQKGATSGSGETLNIESNGSSIVPAPAPAPPSSTNLKSAEEQNPFLAKIEAEESHYAEASTNTLSPQAPNSPQIQPPFAEKTDYGESTNNLPGQVESASTPKKKNKLTIVIIIIVLLLVLLGGGAYYWFFLRHSAEEGGNVQKTPQTTTDTNDTSAQKQQSLDIILNANNPKQSGLGVDISSGSAAIKAELDEYVTEFSRNSSEGDLVELTLVDKSNHSKLISSSDFISGFGLSIPADLSKLLSGDFSLFVAKENSQINMGIVFQVSDKTAAAQELTAQEQALVSAFKPLYIGKSVIFSSTAFSSSKYKNADIRYINSSSTDNSLDYSIIQDSVKNSSYLIVTTSKDQMRSVLDYILVK
ncbi:MAG: hypothetical protein WC858_04955 [Parcubacteria group bacterium]|jgi:hypothetical protein